MRVAPSLPPRECQAVIRSATVLVNSSLSESMPSSMLEAMLLGECHLLPLLLTHGTHASLFLPYVILLVLVFVMRVHEVCVSMVRVLVMRVNVVRVFVVRVFVLLVFVMHVFVERVFVLRVFVLRVFVGRVFVGRVCDASLLGVPVVRLYGACPCSDYPRYACSCSVCPFSKSTL